MSLARRVLFLLPAALLLAGCQSARFAAIAPGADPRPARGPVYNDPGPVEPVEAVPSGRVTSEPLAPPPGTGPVDTPQAGVPAQPDVPPVAAVPEPEPPRTAAITPAAPAAPSRSTVVGGWTAKEAGGTTCRVVLSSTSALDLYKASAGNCSNRDLARVTAWDFRDGEVYLYQPGGAVAARLRASPGNLDGVLAKSGAPLTLTR
jgi:hypothetical protein